MAPRTAYHFSTLAISGVASVAVLASIATALWIFSLLLGRHLEPWLLPDWAQVNFAIGIAFLPGMYIDRKMEKFRIVDSELIAAYSSKRQRALWWLTIFSIIPLALIIGLCFAELRAGQ
jgi:hypothetical protein